MNALQMAAAAKMTDVEQTTASTPADTKESFLWHAKLAQEAKRYEDMAGYMRRVAEVGKPMTMDEDNMLAAAYKHVLDAKRSARRTLALVNEQQQQQQQKDAAAAVDDDEITPQWRVDAVRQYRDRLDGELRELCAEMLTVVVLRQASSEVYKDPATDVFYWKLRADYYRYTAEATEDPRDRAAAVAESRTAYEHAERLGRVTLRPIDPVRLGLMLNYSVFLYQVCDQRQQGHDLAQAAFEEAVAEIDAIDERTYDDATLIMRLIRDNLSIWTEENEGGGGGGGGTNDDAAVTWTPPVDGNATGSPPPLPVTADEFQPQQTADVTFDS